MSSVNLDRLPFWLHGLIELTPSILFMASPAKQLYSPNVIPKMQQTGNQGYSSMVMPRPGAEAIVRQYGVLLFVSILISIIFALRQVDMTSRQVATALALYHLAPVVRAASRLWSGETAWQSDDMGGPWIHLAVHIVCLFALGSLASGVPRNIYKVKVPTKME